MKRLGAVAAIVLASHVFAAYGEDRFPTLRSDSFESGLGVGALAESEGYRNISGEVNAQPVLYLSSKYFRFFANQLDVTLYGDKNLLISLKAEGRFDGFEAKDDAYYEGMEDREGGVYGGFRLEYKLPVVNMVVEGLKSAGGDAEGGYGSIGGYWDIDSPIGSWVPKIAVEYYGSDYTGYYYGVTPAEANPDRPAYQPGSAINLDLGMDYVNQLSGRHQIIASVKYRVYDSEIKNSPLIEKSGSPRVILGYLYRF